MERASLAMEARELVLLEGVPAKAMAMVVGVLEAVLGKWIRDIWSAEFHSFRVRTCLWAQAYRTVQLPFELGIG